MGCGIAFPRHNTGDASALAVLVQCSEGAMDGEDALARRDLAATGANVPDRRCDVIGAIARAHGEIAMDAQIDFPARGLVRQRLDGVQRAGAMVRSGEDIAEVAAHDRLLTEWGRLACRLDEGE
jgi:hypothetical protein